MKDFVHESYGQGALTPPQWFQDRFPIYPAYKVTEWELSFINSDPGFVTRAIFERCLQQTGGPTQEAYWTEKTAYTAVESALSCLDDILLSQLLDDSDRHSLEEWLTETDSEDEDGDSRLSGRT